MEASETDEASQKVPGISVIQLKNVISNGEKKKLNSKKTCVCVQVRYFVLDMTAKFCKYVFL